ncbi:MAG: sulfotransferase [Pseudomonadota bacterium]
MSAVLDQALADAASLTESGQYPIARRKLARLSNTSQNDANVQQGLGAWFYQVGDHVAAAFCFDRWVRADSNSADALISLGSAIQMSGALDQAAASYEAALRLAPDRADAWSNLGTVYQAQRDLNRASDAYERARQIKPDDPDALAGLASIFSYRGESQRAVELLQSVELPAEHVEVALLHADLLRKAGAAQEAEARLRKALKARKLTRSQRARLDFGLGDALDAQDRTDEAFASYLRGNSSRGEVYDAEGHHGFVGYIAYRSGARRTITADAKAPAPLFIIGMPRSGTSLLEQMLDCHPGVVAMGERDALPQLVSGLAGEGSRYPYPEDPAALTWDVLTEAAKQYRAQWTDIDQAQFVTDKLPGNWLYLDIMARLFPNARVINMRRHLADVGWSLFSNIFANGALTFSYSMEDIGAYYADYHQMMELWRARPPLPLLDVHYEDLIAEPEVALRRVSEFLGIGFDDAMLDFHNSRRVTMTASNDQVRKPIYSSSVGRADRYADYLKPLIEAVRAGGVDVDADGSQ